MSWIKLISQINKMSWIKLIFHIRDFSILSLSRNKYKKINKISKFIYKFLF